MNTSPYLRRPLRSEFEARHGLPAYVPRVVPQAHERFPKRRLSQFDIVFAAACFVFVVVGALAAVLG